MKTIENKDFGIFLEKTHFLATCQTNGRMIYEEPFRLTSVLIDSLLRIKTYMIETNMKGRFQLKKNLFICGSKLTGKTCFMALLKTLIDESERFQIRSCMEIEHQTKKYGNSYLNSFFRKHSRSWCFDDFGKRDTHAHLKILKNILKNIARTKSNIPYHIISDYSIEELELLLGKKYSKQITHDFIIFHF